MVIGNVLTANYVILTSSLTGTGNLTLGGLPVTVFNGEPSAVSSVYIQNIIWPTLTSYISLVTTLNTTTALFFATGSGNNVGFVQCANNVITVRGTVVYRI
jgi:hypothetical protein